MVVTPLHLVDSLLGIGCIFEKETVKDNNKTKPIDVFVMSRVRKYAYFFAE